jgi:hypothetical protein
MAEQRSFDARVLAAFFVAAMPFVAFGSFIVVNQSRNLLRESVGLSLEQRAVETKLAVERYVADQIVHLRLLAMDPEVQAALARAKPGDPAAVVGSSLSARTRPLTAVQPAFRQIQLVDAGGRLIAASSRGGRLDNRESAWFKALTAEEGAAEAFVGAPFRPTGSPVGVFEVAVPVRDRDGTLVGAARALVDLGDLYAVLGPVRIGRTGHAVLVRATDGLVLASDETERVLARALPGFPALRSAIEGFPLGESGRKLFGAAGQRRGYWTVPEVREPAAEGHTTLVEPARLIGFAPVDQIAGVEWLVAVEQDLSEALAPVDGVTRYLWIHFIGVFATVILLALYFSLKLERPIMEDALHVHEEHVPAGLRNAAS